MFGIPPALLEDFSQHFTKFPCNNNVLPSFQNLLPRYLDPFRSKRKAYFIHSDAEQLKPLEHELLHNSPDNLMVTPHRKRRPGFHNSPAQNPPFVPSYLSPDDLRTRKCFLSAPTYLPGKSCPPFETRLQI